MTQYSKSLTSLALQKFFKSFWGVISLFFICICTFIAVFGYFFITDKSENANQMHLVIHSKPPGFKVQMLVVPNPEKTHKTFAEYFTGEKITDSYIPISSYSIKNDSVYYTEYSDSDLVQIEKVLPLHIFPEAQSETAFKENYIEQFNYVLGTDNYGRDLLSRLVIGSRVSLAIGFVAVFISLVVGVFFGSIAGFYGGKIDAAVMWLVNIVWSIPTLLLVIAITLALGKGFWQVFVAVGLTMWVEVARVIRGQIISEKQSQYITAARALGFSDWRIITKHILPNCMAPVIVISAANFASAILMESGLSFLGLGAQPPVASWGSMIKDHYSYIILGKAYMAILPGITMCLLVLAFMLIGNTLRDVFDVKN
ncbi:ABC transporter permease [Flavobacterium agricola]|uniref:ABC transporter permease n=1 Tax=Flavobacterium agricola TaxID=2870839 RepID=A0ABY6M263_9FLAO|nr:ABC transporter permease [Flavobacterium agricola]UYW01333.1 ABC transporter permease [Flavobacterium agricola]